MKNVMIGLNAFSNCSKLATVEFNGCTKVRIGESGFKQNSILQSVIFDSQQTELYSSAFQDCTSLTSINLKNAKLYDKVFSGCKKLQTVTFENISTISKRTFDECTSLKELTIKADTVYFELFSLNKCDSLQTINYYGKSTFELIYGCYFVMPKQIQTIHVSNAYEGEAFCEKSVTKDLK